MWKIKTFNALSKQELYNILTLRVAVFVVEQSCPYQEVDGLDSKATHLFFQKEDTIIAYSRLFSPNQYYKGYTAIGRVVIPKSYRGKGLAHELLEQAIGYLSKEHPNVSIKIGAQSYLKKYYESHGFNQVAKPYIEDGIPHIHMLLEKQNN